MGRVHGALSVGAATTLFVLWGLATTAYAQAWLPAKGEGTVSVLFTNFFSTKHYLPDKQYDLGRVDGNTLLFDVTYGISDRMAVNVALPVVMSRYQGAFPHSALDDGNWHSTSQDFRFNVHYNVTRGRLVVTPFIGTDVPSREYQFFAHSAPGSQLKEVLGGVAAGKLFADLGLVVQGRYALAFSESVLDQSRRYSIGSLETAYFLTPAVRLVAMTSSRVAHTGLNLSLTTPLPPEVFLHHDQLARESYLNIGGGAAVSMTDTWEIFGSLTTMVVGRNTHAVNRGISVGVARSFGRQGLAAQPSRDARRDALVKCLCQKASG